MYTMTVIACPTCPANYNNGQRREVDFRYTMTGNFCRADNIPAYVKADCMDIQVKSYHSTICPGTDIVAHCMADAAKRYAYIDKADNMAFIMTKEEYIDFAMTFSYETVDSRENGGEVKMRFLRKNRAIRQYLEARVF